MLTKAVLDHFQTPSTVAEKLGITVQAVCQWKAHVPPFQARRLHTLTDGQLKYDPADYEGHYPRNRVIPAAIEAL